MTNVVEHTFVPSSQPGGRLTALRSLLAEKFPAVEARETSVLPTGLAQVDAGEGGLRRGSLTEMTGPLSAGPLFLEVLLRMLSREKCFAALIDGRHSFSPEDYASSALQRLLWVLCGDAKQAIKAADLLLRDGNLSLIILDLQWVAPRELQRIPASTWHRFQRVVEQTDVIFAVITAQPMVEGAPVRIAVRSRWDLGAMRVRRSQLLTQLELQVFTRATTLAAPQWTARQTA
ncbi:MAG TPA: hypothetical protein VF585_02165 [Chthoniobacterales bacterium]